MKHMQIAIDGPAGAGKSTIAKKVAHALQITYLDTGAMYRAITYKALQEGVDIYNEEALVDLAENTEITFHGEDLYIDGCIRNEEIRDPKVGGVVSHVAKIPRIRRILVELQRRIASDKSIIMDGRDIGTYVLPHARLKVFLTASVEERARRRYIELKQKGTEVSLDDIKQEIIVRDKIDSERSFAPLTKAQDAVVIDTTGRSIDEIVDEIVSLLKGEGENDCI